MIYTVDRTISMVPHDPEPLPASQDVVVSEFADFHVLTYQRTFRIAWRAAGRDEHTAYDAAQDAYTTMLAIWSDRCWRTLGENRAYVTRIAFNKIMDHYRQCGRLTELDESNEPYAEDPAFEAVLDEISVRGAVLRFLDGQPPRRRAVAVLRFLEGYEFDQIGEILDMSASTARTHIERVRVLLKPYLDQITDQHRGGERS